MKGVLKKLIVIGVSVLITSTLSVVASAENTGYTVRNGEVYKGTEKVIEAEEVKIELEDIYSECYEGACRGYEGIVTEKGKEALVTLDKYGSIIYNIQNELKGSKEFEALGVTLDITDERTLEWVKGVYYENLIDAVKAASLEYSYDIFSVSVKEDKIVKLSEYSELEDNEYKYMYTVNPLMGRVNRLNNEEVFEEMTGILFSTTGKERAFSIDVDYINDVTDIRGKGVFKEIETMPELSQIGGAVIGNKVYEPKIAVESFATLYYSNVGKLEPSELAIGLSNYKVYEMSSVMRADGTYNRSVEEIGELDVIKLGKEDINIGVSNGNVIAIVNRYAEVINGVMIGRTFTGEEMYENAPAGYIPTIKRFCMKANIYSVDGMKDIIKYAVENSANKGSILEQLEKTNKDMYNKAMKSLGLKRDNTVLALCIIVGVAIGTVVLVVLRKKRKEKQEKIRQAEEERRLVEIKDSFNSQSVKDSEHDRSRVIMTDKDGREFKFVDYTDDGLNRIFMSVEGFVKVEPIEVDDEKIRKLEEIASKRGDSGWK